MTSSHPQDPTTLLLARWQEGDSEALQELIRRLEGDLKRKAIFIFSKERANRTLQPTALVNEAFIQLAQTTRLDWKSRAHFLAAATRAMERVLIDQARRRSALKRGAGEAPLEIDALASDEPRSEPHVLETIAVHEALAKLSALAPRQAEVARYRCFGGMNHSEIAEVLHVTERTVKSDWQKGKLFLRHALSSSHERGNEPAVHEVS